MNTETMMCAPKKLVGCFCVYVTVCFSTGAQTIDFSSDKDLSYAVGVLLAKSLQDSGVSVDFAAFSEGLRQAIDGKPSIELETALSMVQDALRLAQDKQKEENLKKSTRFMEDNKKKKGVQTTKSGLQYEIIKAGAGTRPKQDSVVVVHYVGSLVDGTVFDSSRDRDEPATIPLQQVIPGWSEGLQLMRVGERARLFIPPNLGYGEESVMDDIPPNSVLVFEIELLEIESD